MLAVVAPLVSLLMALLVLLVALVPSPMPLLVPFRLVTARVSAGGTPLMGSLVCVLLLL